MVYAINTISLTQFIQYRRKISISIIYTQFLRKNSITMINIQFIRKN
jgi:hypothetical protein